MPDHRLACLLCLLLLLVAVSPSSARQQPQGDPDEDAEEEEAALTAKPEPPRQIMNIEVKDNRLNVELENADLGSVIRAIADRAKFKIEGSAASFGKKLTTRFSDIEIERGISRLFSLAKESNYFLHYNTDGTISKLQIFPAGAGTSAVPGPRQPSGMHAPAPPPSAPAAVTPPRTQTTPTAPIRPSAPPPRAIRPQVFPDDEDEDEDDIEAVPYIAPQPRQPLFPPKRK